MSLFLENSIDRNFNCRCGESFSSLEEYEEDFDLIIQHFI